MGKIDARITIPEDLYRQLRAAAAMRGVTLSTMIIEALRSHPDIAAFEGIHSVKLLEDSENHE